MKKSFLPIAIVAVIGVSAAAWGQEPSYKIGWIASFSGPGSVWSAAGTRGIELAVDAINGGNLAGKRVEIVTADDAGDPKTAADVCARFVLQDKVDAIVGFEPTPPRLACNQAALKAGIPYVAAVGTAGDFCFPNMITDGIIANQMIDPLVGYLAKTGAKRFYLLASDYSTPRATMKLAQTVIAKLGGEVVGQTFTPVGTSDFSPVFAKIAAAKPDAIVVSVIGTDDLTFHKQFSNDPRVSAIQRGDVLLFESVARTLGASGKGVIAVSGYFADVRSPANEVFTAAFEKRFARGVTPDVNTVNAYNGMLLLASALKQGNGDPKAVIAALDHAAIDDPGGRLSIVDRYAAQPIYIGRAAGDGTIKVMEGTAPIAPAVTCKK